MVDLYGDDLPARASVRLGCIRLMHPQRVADVAYSPDGRLIASCSDDLRVWAADDGCPVHRLGTDDHRVRRAAFSPDGRGLAAVGDDGMLRLWNTTTGELDWEASLRRQEGRAVAFSANELIVVGACTNVLIFTRRGKLLCQFEDCEGWVCNIAVHPDNGRVYVATERDLWSFQLPTRRLWRWSLPVAGDHRRLAEEFGGALAMAPGGRSMVSAAERRLLEWDLETESLLREVANDGQVGQLSVSPTGEHWLIAGREGAERWSSAGEHLETFAENHYGVDVVAYSPTGESFVTGAMGGDVRVWDAAGPTERLTFFRHRDLIESLSLSPDAARLVSVSSSKTIRVWDCRTGAPLHSIDQGRDGGTLVAYAPTGGFFAGARGDGTVVLYDPETASAVERLETPEASGWFRSLAISPDGEHVVACRGDQELHCWRRGQVRPAWTKGPPRGRFSALHFSPDGRHLAAGDASGVHVWRFPGGEAVSQFGDLVITMGFIDDETIVGFGSDGFACTWDLATGEQRSRSWYSGSFPVVSPAADVVAFDDDGVTTFRALPGLEEVHSLDRGDRSVLATFSRDGQSFAAVEGARNVVLWDLSGVDFDRASRGPRPVYPGVAALAGYRLILRTAPAADFEGVRFGDGWSHRASPPGDDFDFLGIEINIAAIGRVLTPDAIEAMHHFDPPVSPVVPMAGYLGVATASASSPGADIDNVYVVAVDVSTGAEHRGRLIMDRPTHAQLAVMPTFADDLALDSDAEEADVAPHQDCVQGSWFTINLSEQVTLPGSPAVYRVHLEHAVVESLRSEEVRVEIVD